MNSFEDKVGIVTGRGSGIGRALCEELGRRGMLVIVAGITAENLEEVASGIEATGGKARTASLDVSQAEEVKAVIEQTVSQEGRLDYLFNNAGITLLGEVHDMTLEHWRHVVDVNLMGVINGICAAYPLMVRQGFGHIINTSSVGGIIGYPSATAYAATKSAIIVLSTSLRAEARAFGIKVSVVCAGYVRTRIFNSCEVLNADREEILARIPFKMIEPKKAARAILRGVRRNQSMIIFPTHAKLLWWLYRLNPYLIELIGRKMIKNFRKSRDIKKRNPG